MNFAHLQPELERASNCLHQFLRWLLFQFADFFDFFLIFKKHDQSVKLFVSRSGPLGHISVKLYGSRSGSLVHIRVKLFVSRSGPYQCQLDLDQDHWSVSVSNCLYPDQVHISVNWILIRIIGPYQCQNYPNPVHISVKLDLDLNLWSVLSV